MVVLYTCIFSTHRNILIYIRCPSIGSLVIVSRGRRPHNRRGRARPSAETAAAATAVLFGRSRTRVYSALTAESKVAGAGRDEASAPLAPLLVCDVITHTGAARTFSPQRSVSIYISTDLQVGYYS